MQGKVRRPSCWLQKTHATAFMELIRKWNLQEIAGWFLSLKAAVVQARSLWGKSVTSVCVCVRVCVCVCLRVCVCVHTQSLCHSHCQKFFFLLSLWRAFPVSCLSVASIRLIIFLVNYFFTLQSCHVWDGNTEENSEFRDLMCSVLHLLQSI